MDLRIYRASLVVALLALVVVMFSLQERPRAADARRSPPTRSRRRRLERRQAARRTASRTAGRAAPGTQRSGDSSRSALPGARAGDVARPLQRRVERRGHVDVERDRRAERDTPTARSLVHRPPRRRRAPRRLERVGTAGCSSWRRRSTAPAATRRSCSCRPTAAAAGRRRCAPPRRELPRPRARWTRCWCSTTSARDARGAPVRAAVVDRLAAAARCRCCAPPRRRSRGRPASRRARNRWPGQFLRQAWPLTLREQGPLVARRAWTRSRSTAHGELPRRAPAGDTPRTDLAGAPGQLRPSRLRDGARARRRAVDRELAAALHRRGQPRGPGLGLRAAGGRPRAARPDHGARRLRPRHAAAGSRWVRWTRWVLAGAVPFAVTLAVAWCSSWSARSRPPSRRRSSPSAGPRFGEVAIAARRSWPRCSSLSWLYLRPRPWARRATLVASRGRGEAALALLISLEALARLRSRTPSPRCCWCRPPTSACSRPLPRSPSRPLLIGADDRRAALALPALALLYYGVRLDLGLDPRRYALMVLTAATGSLCGAVARVSAWPAAWPRSWSSRWARARARADAPITVRGRRATPGPGRWAGRVGAAALTPQTASPTCRRTVDGGLATGRTPVRIPSRPVRADSTWRGAMRFHQNINSDQARRRAGSAARAATRSTLSVSLRRSS